MLRLWKQLASTGSCQVARKPIGSTFWKCTANGLQTGSTRRNLTKTGTTRNFFYFTLPTFIGALESCPSLSLLFFFISKSEPHPHPFFVTGYAGSLVQCPLIRPSSSSPLVDISESTIPGKRNFKEKKILKVR